MTRLSGIFGSKYDLILKRAREAEPTRWFYFQVSEQPKVVSGVCVANSKDETERVRLWTQGTIPLPLKQLRSF